LSHADFLSPLWGLYGEEEITDPDPDLMSRPALPLFALFLGSSFLEAGNYSQDFSGYSSGDTNLGDGSEIGSNNGVAQVRGSGDLYFRLTSNSIGGTRSSFKLPDLDPGEVAESFSATFRFQIGGTEPFADGAALSFGAIPAGNGAGENGFASANGLVISWDTFANVGEVPSIEIFSNGASVFNQPFTFSNVANRWVEVELTWDEDGLDFSYDGVSLVTDLSLPGFVISAGDRFAFSGRTGGSRQSTYLDDLDFQTILAGNIETGGPVISEFMADNQESHEDDDLNEPDWLEIYNGQNTSVDLDEYYLTNDLTKSSKWQLPAVSLGPYQYLVVFASGKNRSNSNKPLHTDFTLPKSGGYLALLAPDGTTVLSEYQYDPQEEDIAYGELGPNRVIGYLETPTPGERNDGLVGDGPPAEDVVFDRPGGLFFGSTTLAILLPVSPTGVVRYTTDGTVPTESSTVYSEAFAISTTTTIRARVFEAGQLPGDLKSRTLLEVDSGLRNFSSNLPIMVLDSNGVNIDAANKPDAPRPFRPVYSVVIDRDDADGLARLDGTPDFTGRGGAHVRGNSSSGFPKKQYALETWNNEDEDKDVSLLGMPEESDWILQAPYSDKTMMRNALVYEASRELNGNLGGVRTRYVEVFFNQNNGTVTENDYRGVYVLMEKIKRDKERVDVEKLNDLVTDPELISGGYIFKRDKAPYSNPWNTAIENAPFDMHYPEDPNEAQFNFLTGYLDEMEGALYGPKYKDPDSGYAAYLDVPSFIDAHLFVEAFKNIDGYRISTYFSKPRDGKVQALPIWDYNLALGNSYFLTGDDPEGWYYDLTSPADYYWYDRMFVDEEFELAYWDRFWELRRGMLSTPGFYARIDRHAAELQGDAGAPNALTRNFDEWDILGTNIWPNPDGWDDRTTYEDEVDWMKAWFEDRLDWIETQSKGTSGLAQPPEFNQFGGEVANGFQLVMTQSNGWDGAQIYYTLDGRDPRVSPNSAVTLIAENATCEVLVPAVENGGDLLTVSQWTNPSSPSNSSEWLSGQQGVGYERSSSNLYDSFFNLDIEAEMAGINKSCYIRIPFTISSQAEIDELTGLTLKMRYDDSFVAYLNGVEIVREANAPDPLLYDSGAEDQHGDADALEYVDFPAGAGLAELQVGPNVLAIHGLNDSLFSSDALWACLLKGSAGSANSPSASARLYSNAFNLNSSTEVMARVFDGSKWSPLSQASFFVNTVPADSGNLVVSEFDYRPAAPTAGEVAAGFDSRGDFEYLELMNIHASNPVSLEGVAFVGGVTFSGFDKNLPTNALVLSPGERILLVKNEAAFRFRYAGFSGVIAGEFSGSLRNEGEQVILHDAVGGVIRDFTYSSEFPWPVSAGDGQGFALVLSDPLANPIHDDPLTWRASVAVGGSPGGDDTVPFTGNPNVDGDGDGLTMLLEYVFGTSDADPNDHASIHVSFVESGGEEFLQVAIPASLSTTGIEVVLESSGNLIDWNVSAGLAQVSETNHGDGTITRSYRSLLPVPSGIVREFFRVRAELN